MRKDSVPQAVKTALKREIMLNTDYFNIKYLSGK